MMILKNTVAGERKYPSVPFMKSAGDGIAEFTYMERLDRFQLRSYCSNTVAKITIKLENAIARQQPATVGEEEEDIEDDLSDDEM